MEYSVVEVQLATLIAITAAEELALVSRHERLDLLLPQGSAIDSHIVDLAQAHMLALEPRKCGFYNLGNGEGYSVREVIETCRQVSGKEIPAIEEPRRPGDPARLIAGSQKTIEELGWKPRYATLEQIVDSAWRWHSAHPHGYPG